MYVGKFTPASEGTILYTWLVMIFCKVSLSNAIDAAITITTTLNCQSTRQLPITLTLPAVELEGCLGGGWGGGGGSVGPQALVLPLSVLVKPLKWCFVAANSISHVSSFNSLFRDSNELKRSLMKTRGLKYKRYIVGAVSLRGFLPFATHNH